MILVNQTRRFGLYLVVLSLATLLLFLAACGPNPPQPTPTPTATATATATPSPTPTSSPTPRPTPSPTPIPTATPSPTPTQEVCDTNGVTLFVDPNFQGHCHTFGLGSWDLASYGLDRNVSSLRDPGCKFHITLRDINNRPGYFDKSYDQLPADWNDQAHSMLVENRTGGCSG